MQVVNINDTLLVDSREVAVELGIQHKNLLALVDKYSPKMAGNLAVQAPAFETREYKTSQGNTVTERWAMLTEVQANFIGALSNNTEKVVDFKLALVVAFAEAKQRLDDNSLKTDDLNVWAKLRKEEGAPIQVLFQNACLRNKVPANHVHDFITAIIVQHTAKTARELPLVAGDPDVGMNHHPSLEQQATINNVKLTFAGLSRRKGETYKDMVHRAIWIACPD